MLDFSGSSAAAMLAELGAEVIAVHRPGAQPRGGKPRSLALDVENAGAQKVLERLCGRCDVVIEGRPVLGYDALRKHNSALIYCSAPGADDAGSLAAIAVLGALQARNRSGRGANVDLALLASRFSGGGGAAQAGEHSREILVELGFDDSEIADFFHARAVAF